MVPALQKGPGSGPSQPVNGAGDKNTHPYTLSVGSIKLVYIYTSMINAGGRT